MGPERDIPEALTHLVCLVEVREAGCVVAGVAVGVAQGHETGADGRDERAVGAEGACGEGRLGRHGRWLSGILCDSEGVLWQLNVLD